MTRDIFDIREKEEAFYPTKHYIQFNLTSKSSWLSYQVKDLVELGTTIANKKEKCSFS